MIGIVISAISGFLVMLLCLGKFGTIKLLFMTVFEVMKNEFVLFIYLFLILACGLVVISHLERFYENFKVRKMFHALAFILFVPPIINAHIEPPKLMVLAFNCISVAMIILEILRYQNCLPE